MFALLLTIHALTAFVAFGPVFAFSFLGYMSGREPQFANVLVRAVHLMETRLVLPLGFTQWITGVLLILNQHTDLTKNAWLGVAIILYIATYLAAVLHQVPTGHKLIEMTKNGPPSDPAAAMALGARLKNVGMAMTVSLVTIIVLMVWKPGFTG